MLHGLFFGAVLDYCPPDGSRERCVYIRNDNGVAVVIFQRSEIVSRVNPDWLEWSRR